jgi:predicted permease
VSIFAFVDAALIKPLPYRNPSQLVSVYETAPLCPLCNVAYQNYVDWKKSNQIFRSFDVWGYTNYLLNTSEGSRPAPGVRVSDGFFRTLGVTPILGRDFYAGEDAPGAPRTVLLSYSAWQNRFGGKADVVGQTVTLSDVAYTIIGVLPRDFNFAPRGNADFWATLNDLNSCEKRRACHSLFGIARLRDGISVQTAASSMVTAAQQLEKQYPDSNKDMGATVTTLSESIIGDIRPILLMLLGGAALLLLIACINVASLLLVRSESRKREMAVRGALGASPARLVRQFVTEGLVLVLTGSVVGLASAALAMRLLFALISVQMLGTMPYLQQLGLNPRVLAFAGLIALLAIALFSITPALRLPSSDLRGDLSEGGRGSAGNTWRRVGSRLVVLELATAVVLLAGAGLLGKSLYFLLHVDTGIQPDHLASIRVDLPKTYIKDEDQIPLMHQIVDRVGTLPSVRSAAVADSLPIGSWDEMTRIHVLGRPNHGERNEVPERGVSSGYLATLGAKLMRGRYFTVAEDDPSKPRVVIINEAFAKQYFPGENPVGKQIAYVSSQTPIEIVGVVEDVKEGALDSESLASMYLPFNQNMSNSFYVIVRTSQAEQTMLPTLAATIHQIDRDIATSDAATMNDIINDSQSAYLHRSSAWLVGGFAALALLLGVVGLYGVIAYSVSQRTREIGVRMALGAARSSVYRLILKEAGWLTAVGILAGLASSIAAATLMGKLLFGVRSWDVPTLAAVAAVLGIAALLASYIPARRAASVNPVEALRAE